MLARVGSATTDAPLRNRVVRIPTSFARFGLAMNSLAATQMSTRLSAPGGLFVEAAVVLLDLSRMIVDMRVLLLQLGNMLTVLSCLLLILGNLLLVLSSSMVAVMDFQRLILDRLFEATFLFREVVRRCLFTF